MKTILKSALILFLPLIFNSCHNDETLSEKNGVELNLKNQSKNDNELLRGESSRELYSEVVNSEDQFATYHSLDYKQKQMFGKVNWMILLKILN
ncbi:hypothetical protein [Chryseobacterium sp. Leaf201]|uniref:hypothetical protein n=1 Tax=Chryseobacterium sp. Leaf201 TaxID=1735672 RepID=UPI000700F83F|nr:hypothetical protein [Chryseobacterium sp. Leaf201]KQM62015.1 hypothetical protein ASE55_18885 [Chryseobacterium sp. Leaf201]